MRPGMFRSYYWGISRGGRVRRTGLRRGYHPGSRCSSWGYPGPGAGFRAGAAGTAVESSPGHGPGHAEHSHDSDAEHGVPLASRGPESGGGVFRTGRILGRRARTPNESRSGQVRYHITRPKSRTMRVTRQLQVGLPPGKKVVTLESSNARMIEMSRQSQPPNVAEGRDDVPLHCRKQLTR